MVQFWPFPEPGDYPGFTGIIPDWIIRSGSGSNPVLLADNPEPLLTLPFSAKDHHGGWTQIWNVSRIWRINHHPVESNQDSPLECISDTEDWLNRNENSDNATVSDDNWAVDIESDIEHDNGIEHPEYPEQRNVSATPNFPDWSSLHGSQRDRLNNYWWRSIQSTCDAIQVWRKCRKKCINVSPASLCILTQCCS